MEHFTTNTSQTSQLESRRIEADLDTLLDMELSRRHQSRSGIHPPHIEVKCIHRNPLAEKQSSLLHRENEELRDRCGQLQRELKDKTLELMHKHREGAGAERDARQLAKFIKRSAEDQLEGRQKVENLLFDMIEELDRLEARLNRRETPVLRKS